MTDEVTGNLTMTAVVIVFIVVLWFVVVRLVNASIDRFVNRERDQHDKERRDRVTTMWSVVRRLFLIALLAAGAWSVALVWEIPTTPFIAVGSAVGVAVGFGAQSFVKDVIAGFLILGEDQFHIGDVVNIAGVSGEVQDVRLRVTVLRDLDGIVHYVPNGSIDVTSNYTQEFSRIVVDVSVAYGADTDQVIAVLRSVLDEMAADSEWTDIVLEPPEILGVNRLGDSAVEIRTVFTTDPDLRWAVKREALARVKRRFDEEGIEIPFPQRTVWLRPPDESS